MTTEQHQSAQSIICLLLNSDSENWNETMQEIEQIESRHTYNEVIEIRQKVNAEKERLMKALT